MSDFWTDDTTLCIFRFVDYPRQQSLSAGRSFKPSILVKDLEKYSKVIETFDATTVVI
jgi:hypothetical protein